MGGYFYDGFPFFMCVVMDDNIFRQLFVFLDFGWGGTSYSYILFVCRYIFTPILAYVVCAFLIVRICRILKIVV